MSDKALKIKSRIHDYRVIFADDFLREMGERLNQDVFLIIDEKLLDIYSADLAGAILKERLFAVEAIEQNKNLDYCYALIKELVRKNIRRSSVVIVMGGGIVQDIASFSCSVILRGVNWYFYPTTLLAQADSCIGGKTSINLEEYKNTIGKFYPPVSVTIDTGLLLSLDAKDVKSGIGEILHYYFIADSHFISVLAGEYENLLTERTRLKRHIFASLYIKKKFIEADEFDRGLRNLLNYGHTFGHALESVTSYKINHGQAVTVGMDLANYISLRLGYLKKAKFDLMHSILKPNFPEFELKNIDIANYFSVLSRDKKNLGSDLVCILTRGPGRMFKVRTAIDEKVKAMIGEYFAIGSQG